MKVHYGTSARLRYTWDGRDKFYGSRIVSVLSYYAKVKDDPRFTLCYIEVNRQRVQPHDIEVTR